MKQPQYNFDAVYFLAEELEVTRKIYNKSPRAGAEYLRHTIVGFKDEWIQDMDLTGIKNWNSGIFRELKNLALKTRGITYNKGDFEAIVRSMGYAAKYTYLRTEEFIHSVDRLRRIKKRYSTE